MLASRANDIDDGLWSYTEDFQQLQIELCVLREEIKAMHDQVQLIADTKRMVKIMFVGWCILIANVVLLVTMTLM